MCKFARLLKNKNKSFPMIKKYSLVLLTFLCSTAIGFSQCFTDDFSSGLGAWSNTGDWTTTGGELKHDLSSTEAESYIYADLGAQDLTTGDFEWDVCIRNGNWDPSGANRFSFFLLSSNNNLMNNGTGYAVGVNQVGTADDFLTLYSVNNGAYTEIIQSTLNWDANDDVCIRVTRNSTGTWELFYNPNGTGEVSAGTVVNTTYTAGNYIGGFFDFTSSRAGLLWFDDIVVDCGAVVPNITLSTSTLTGLDYVLGAGPSAEQTFTAEGALLTNDIVLTAPTNFEISTTSGAGFGSSVTLTQTGGNVATTKIYKRLAAGLAVNTPTVSETCTDTN